MLEQPSYPWTVKAEEIPPHLKSSNFKQSQGKAFSFSITTSLLAGFGFSLATGLIIVQQQLIQPNYSVTVPEWLHNATVDDRLEVVPSPTRYEFLTAKTLETIQPEKTTQSGHSFPHFIAINQERKEASTGFTPAVLDQSQPLPPVLPINLSPAPSTAPMFSLLGIAQGMDGVIATVKIKQDNNTEMKDVRVGEALQPGYVVTRIEEEYLLITHKSNGTVIRVD